MKEVWFQYVVDNRFFWFEGFTLKRLAKVRDHVLADEHTIWDLLDRNGAKEMSPDQMKAADSDTFYLCIGNFYCSIFTKMVDLGICKIR